MLAVGRSPTDHCFHIFALLDDEKKSDDHASSWALPAVMVYHPRTVVDGKASMNSAVMDGKPWTIGGGQETMNNADGDG